MSFSIVVNEAEFTSCVSVAEIKLLSLNTLAINTIGILVHELINFCLLAIVKTSDTLPIQFVIKVRNYKLQIYTMTLKKLLVVQFLF